MPVAPFVPLIASGVGALFGSKSSSTPNAATTGAMGQTLQSGMNTAGNVSGLSKYLATQGQMAAPAFGRAMSYYQTLLGGNRAAMQQAVAPAAGQITDAAKGQQMNLERMGIVGGARDQARAEIARQAGGQLGGLTVGVQAGAADQLGRMGQAGLGMVSQGVQGLGTAGNIYSQLLSRQSGVNQMTYNRQQQQGSSLAGLIMPVLNTFANRSRGGTQPGETLDTNIFT